MKLIDCIQEARRDVEVARTKLDQAERHLRNLYDLRAWCPHMFEVQSGSVHNDPTCTKCGASEVEAAIVRQHMEQQGRVATAGRVDG